MKTIHYLKQLYEFAPHENIPVSLKAATQRAVRLETITKLCFNASAWEKKYCKLKQSGKSKRQQTGVHFGNVKMYYSPQTDTTGVIAAETAPISDKIDREITSRSIMEQCVLPLLCQDGPLQFASNWIYTAGGTYNDLHNRLISCNITLKQLVDDLQYIMTYFEKNYVAILGYRSAWKLLPTYEEMIYKPISSRQMGWVKTGKRFPFLPKIRRYLIKVCKDPITAARCIQNNWRTWKKIS